VDEGRPTLKAALLNRHHWLLDDNNAFKFETANFDTGVCV